MKYFLVGSETGNPLYFDHPDGRMLIMPMATMQEVMSEFYDERFVSMRSGNVRLAFQKYGGYVLCAVSDQHESDLFLRGQLYMLHRLFVLLFGPNALKRHQSPYFLRHKKTLQRLIDLLSNYSSSMQSFLVKAAEDVEISAGIRTHCRSELKRVLSFLPHATHAMLFVGTKVLAMYHKSGYEKLNPMDVFLIILYYRSYFHPIERHVEDNDVPVADYTDHASVNAGMHRTEGGVASGAPRIDDRPASNLVDSTSGKGEAEGEEDEGEEEAGVGTDESSVVSGGRGTASSNAAHTGISSSPDSDFVSAVEEWDSAPSVSTSEAEWTGGVINSVADDPLISAFFDAIPIITRVVCDCFTHWRQPDSAVDEGMARVPRLAHVKAQHDDAGIPNDHVAVAFLLWDGGLVYDESHSEGRDAEPAPSSAPNSAPSSPTVLASSGSGSRLALQKRPSMEEKDGAADGDDEPPLDVKAANIMDHQHSGGGGVDEATETGEEAALALTPVTRVRRQAVVFLQYCLCRLSSYEGSIDGCFGPRTYQGLVKFRRQHGLSGDDVTVSRHCVECLLENVVLLMDHTHRHGRHTEDASEDDGEEHDVLNVYGTPLDEPNHNIPQERRGPQYRRRVSPRLRNTDHASAAMSNDELDADDEKDAVGDADATLAAQAPLGDSRASPSPLIPSKHEVDGDNDEEEDDEVEEEEEDEEEEEEDEATSVGGVADDGVEDGSSEEAPKGAVSGGAKLGGGSISAETTAMVPIMRKLFLRFPNYAPCKVYFSQLKSPVTLVVVSDATKEDDDSNRLRDVESHLKSRHSLGSYFDFFIAKEHTHLSMLSYVHQFPGLVHFIVVDRTNHRVLAPSIQSLAGQEFEGTGSPAMDEQQVEFFARVLKERVWDMVFKAQDYLSRGYSSMLLQMPDFQYSYRMWAQDSNGNERPFEASLHEPHKLPLSSAFYEDLRCHTFGANSDTKLYELYALYLGFIGSATIRDYNTLLLRELETSFPEFFAFQSASK